MPRSSTTAAHLRVGRNAWSQSTPAPSTGVVTAGRGLGATADSAWADTSASAASGGTTAAPGAAPASTGSAATARSVSVGMSPSPSSSSRCRAISTPSVATTDPRCGTESSSWMVYGSTGRWKISSAVPRSTMSPSFITRMRSAMSATTPMSWVIRMIDASMRSFRSRISLRISAWTVTSSAVVGSSAINSLGSSASDWAIIARCR